jgi:hypothetical protein
MCGVSKFGLSRQVDRSLNLVSTYYVDSTALDAPDSEEPGALPLQATFLDAKM